MKTKKASGVQKAQASKDVTKPKTPESVPVAPTLKSAQESLKRVNSHLKDPADGKYSPLGHKMTSDSGKIDVAILKGGCLDLATLADTCCGFSNTSKRTRESFPFRCRRVRNHEYWKAATAGRKGKGLDTRLKNVYAEEATKTGKAIADDLKVIASYIGAQYRTLFPRKAAAEKTAA